MENIFTVYQSFDDGKTLELAGYEALNDDGNYIYRRVNLSTKQLRPDWQLGMITDNQGNAKFYRYRDIGLKDINDKPIYADSSICKIEWRDNRYSNLKREFGYFSHNKEKHCLEFIITIDTLPIKRINFIQHIDFIVSLEIIDTKQKNKLGLIKDESWAK